MALFPAFAEEATDKVKKPSQELDWLNNKSFQKEDAVDLHNRFLEKSIENIKEEESVSWDVDSSEEKDKEDVGPPPKKRKSDKKKKKKKKHKKRSERASSSSGSDSETVFPSDLKKEEEEERPPVSPLASCFSWLDDIQLPASQPFCVDRKPDPANWTYKSLYRGHVASYKRQGDASLGLNPLLREEIIREDSNTKKKDKKGSDRYFSAASRRLVRSEPPLPVLPGTSDIIGSLSFLSLDHTDGDNSGQKTGVGEQKSSVNPLGIYDSSTSLWLQGKGQQDDKKQEHGAGEFANNPFTKKTEEFNRRLREQPSDIQLWIDFIRYQDELSAAVFGGEAEPQFGDSAEHRKSSCKALLEKKLSIAERAVETNPTCIALQLERLNICKELWEPTALAKEWKKLVFLHPNSAPLWRQYLLFTQSYFSNFSVSKVNAAYGKCLSTLSAVQDGSMLSHPALPGTEEDMLDIFVQQCQFLRQSGHSEKAISLFQAMMDFTFFKPESVCKLSTKQQVEFFEPFWDSGEARVGEAGARGWKAWMLQHERGGWIQPGPEEEEEDDDEEEDEEEVKDKKRPRWSVWLDLESSREAHHWLPWRPDKTKGQSEEDCEDPDRQVLFDDIGSSLICLSSAELQLQLLLRFLSFLGLPVDPARLPASQQTSLLLENISLLTQGNETDRPLTSYDLPEFGVNTVGHMTTLQGSRKCVGLGKQGETFLGNALAMIQPLLSAHHRSQLTLCLIQYEKLKVWRCLHGGTKKRLRAQGRTSKRVAKRLLKEPENRSSLPLWREYAHLEWLLGNQDEARKVFSTAGAAAGPTGLNSAAVCELSLLWARLEVEAKQRDADVPSRDAEGNSSSDEADAKHQAVGVLSRLAEENASPSSPMSILKARRSYEQVLTRSLETLEQNIGKPDSKGDLTEEKFCLSGLVGCYALFQYLTVGIQAATAVYSQARGHMEELHQRLAEENRSSTGAPNPAAKPLARQCEALAVQLAALLNFHKNTSVFSLGTLREAVTCGLSSWPSSAALWSIYVQVENRYHSAGRARRFFHSITRDNDSVVPRLFAIVAEQQRKQLVDAAQRSCGYDNSLSILPETGLGNRICGLFENAIATETGVHCPLLWRMYIYFLVSEGKADKAKGIFYKALQNIPWVKGLYLDAVQLFPEQLQEFTDLMMEKELRLRLPLEELEILLED